MKNEKADRPRLTTVPTTPTMPTKVYFPPAAPPRPPAGYKSFPTGLLPDAAAAMVRAGAASIGCDESYLALSALAALGSTIGNARVAIVKADWTEPPIIWAMLIGPSGTAKTPAARIVLAPVHERHARLIAAGEQAAKAHALERQRYEAELAAWKRKPRGDPPAEPDPPPAERVMIEDTTIEALAPILRANPRGVLLHRDELAGWIGSFDRYAQSGGGDMPRWLSIFNAEAITVDRRTSGTTYVRRPAVSIIGGIQPGRLPAVLTQTLRDSGLLARFLVASPPPMPKRFNADGLDAAVADGWRLLLSLLATLEPAADGETPMPLPMAMTGPAQAAFGPWCDALNAETINKPADTAAARSKLEAYAVRFALIFAVCDLSSVIDVAHAHRGCELADWFAAEAERIYNAIGHTHADREAAELAAWIERRGGRATRHEITASGPRAYRGKPDAADAVLSRLANDGRGQWQHDPARNGRPAERFVLTSTHGDGTETPHYARTTGGFISESSPPVAERGPSHAA